MQAIQQSIKKDIKIPEVSLPTGFYMVFQKLQHDHINIYYNFTKMGPYYTFSFDKCFFHLTTCHETSPTRTSVYLHHTWRWYTAAVMLGMDERKVHPFPTFKHLRLINVPLAPNLNEAPLLFSPIIPRPFLSYHSRKMVVTNVYLFNISLPDVRSCNLHESQDCALFCSLIII